jgi:hypothetical protein
MEKATRYGERAQNLTEVVDQVTGDFVDDRPGQPWASAGPKGVSDKQLGYLRKLLREAGLTSEDGLVVARELTGRQLSSVADLSAGEASQVIDHLKARPQVDRLTADQAQANQDAWSSGGNW